MNESFQLQRNAFGRLCLTNHQGQVFEDIFPVRAFPLSAADEGVCLISATGRELVWLERLSTVAPATRHMILEELATREFMPRIQRIRQVSSYATPSLWTVETDRGLTHLLLAAEENIRRLDHERLLITDKHGLGYLLPNLSKLDRHSRRLLDHFL